MDKYNFIFPFFLQNGLSIFLISQRYWMKLQIQILYLMKKNIGSEKGEMRRKKKKRETKML